MTVRLSHSSLTGTERTEVAVGTDSEMSMFWAVRIGAPRMHGELRLVGGLGLRGRLGVAGLGGGGALGGLGGSGLLARLGGRRGGLLLGRLRGRGGLLGRLRRSLGGLGGVLGGRLGAGLLSGLRRRTGGGLAEPALVPLPALPFSLKYAVHSGPTDPGSFLNWSYISSTSQSLAPKSARGLF